MTTVPAEEKQKMPHFTFTFKIRQKRKLNTAEKLQCLYAGCLSLDKPEQQGSHYLQIAPFSGSKAALQGVVNTTLIKSFKLLNYVGPTSDTFFKNLFCVAKHYANQIYSKHTKSVRLNLGNVSKMMHRTCRIFPSDEMVQL